MDTVQRSGVGLVHQVECAAAACDALHWHHAVPDQQAVQPYADLCDEFVVGEEHVTFLVA